MADDALDLRVYRCSTAEASADLGEIEGTLDVSFEYAVEAEGWFERPLFVVREDGEERYRSSDDDDVTIKTTEFDTTSGTVSTSVPVDGDVAVAFRLEPSNHCSNLDYENTYFEVEAVSIEVE